MSDDILFKERKSIERQQLCCIIQQWNANRLDIFEISQPNEDLEFHGVMRFYFQDAGQKVATKCIRVASTASSNDVIHTLIEKFRPDFRMLSVPEYALYELHENGEERKLSEDEKPLLVQLNWHKDDREGRFLLRRMDEKTHLPGFDLDADGVKFRRDQQSKKKKKEKKKKNDKKDKKENEINNDKDNKSIADKLYKELPETSFTRSISNPEAVMRRRREQKLQKKLLRLCQEGGPEAGGTLRIFGESLDKDVPYKTLLLSSKDKASTVVREILNKYGKDREDPSQYCLVQIIVPIELCENPANDLHTATAGLRQYILDDDDCPLFIEKHHNKQRGILSFHIKRKPADYQPRKRKKKPEMIKGELDAGYNKYDETVEKLSQLELSQKNIPQQPHPQVVQQQNQIQDHHNHQQLPPKPQQYQSPQTPIPDNFRMDPRLQDPRLNSPRTLQIIPQQQQPQIHPQMSPMTPESIPDEQKVIYDHPSLPEVSVIKLQKCNNCMGLSIVAAKGANQDKMGIFIKSVVKGGAADLDGRLQAGDQLLKVDGHPLIGISQEKAAELITQTGSVVTLEVAKQAAMYNGLAVLLNQSPLVSRGYNSPRDLDEDRMKPPDQIMRSSINGIPPHIPPHISAALQQRNQSLPVINNQSLEARKQMEANRMYLQSQSIHSRTSSTTSIPRSVMENNKFGTLPNPNTRQSAQSEHVHMNGHYQYPLPPYYQQQQLSHHQSQPLQEHRNSPNNPSSPLIVNPRNEQMSLNPNQGPRYNGHPPQVNQQILNNMPRMQPSRSVPVLNDNEIIDSQKNGNPYNINSVSATLMPTRSNFEMVTSKQLRFQKPPPNEQQWAGSCQSPSLSQIPSSPGYNNNNSLSRPVSQMSSHSHPHQRNSYQAYQEERHYQNISMYLLPTNNSESSPNVNQQSSTNIQNHPTPPPPPVPLQTHIPNQGWNDQNQQMNQNHMFNQQQIAHQKEIQRQQQLMQMQQAQYHQQKIQQQMQQQRLQRLKMEEIRRREQEFQAAQQEEERLLREAKRRQEIDSRLGKKNGIHTPDQTSPQQFRFDLTNNQSTKDIPPPLPKSPPPLEINPQQRLDKLLTYQVNGDQDSNLNSTLMRNSKPSLKDNTQQLPMKINSETNKVPMKAVRNNASPTVLNLETNAGNETINSVHSFTLQDIDEVLDIEDDPEFNNNYTINNTPNVIGAQEVYKDPRERIKAEKMKNQPQKPLPQVPEKLSFKEKMKMFARETGQDDTPKDKVKISKAQREIESENEDDVNSDNSQPNSEYERN